MIYFGNLLFVSRSQCSHCFLLLLSNLLEINSKIPRNEFIEPTLLLFPRSFRLHFDSFGYRWKYLTISHLYPVWRNFCRRAQWGLEFTLLVQIQGVRRRNRILLLRRTIFETNKWYVVECGFAVSGIDCKIIQK